MWFVCLHFLPVFVCVCIHYLVWIGCCNTMQYCRSWKCKCAQIHVGRITFFPVCYNEHKMCSVHMVHQTCFVSHINRIGGVAFNRFGTISSFQLQHTTYTICHSLVLGACLCAYCFFHSHACRALIVTCHVFAFPCCFYLSSRVRCFRMINSPIDLVKSARKKKKNKTRMANGNWSTRNTQQQMTGKMKNGKRQSNFRRNPGR